MKKYEGMGTFFSQMWWLEASLPLCAAQHVMGTWPNSLPSPEAAAGSVILFPSSLPSRWLFSLSRLKAGLCVYLYAASSSGAACHGRLSQICAEVISLLLRSQPTACLPLPACLEQLSTHRGLSTRHVGHKVKGNLWREVFFFFWKREVGKKSSPENLVYYFRGKTVRWNLTVCRETNWQPKMLRN